MHRRRKSQLSRCRPHPDRTIAPAERACQGHGRYEFKKIRFSFAQDNYILPLAPYHGAKTYMIKVEDIDGAANGCYLGATYVVRAEDYFDLHDNVGWPHIRDNTETLPPSQEFHHTITIRLEQKGS